MKHLRYASFLFMSILLVVSASRAAITDPAYHTLAEINERIFFLEDSMRNIGKHWLRVDSIGYSQNEHRPIYCVKLAEPDVDDTTTERPAVIYIGQVHAEEVLGVEFTLWLIDQWLGRNGNNWRRRLDTYIIPTANPEGLNTVYTLDFTYRKNKRDNIGDGRFRYLVGWGQDTSGVDINRNFPLFWVKGSSFLKRGDNEFYDYYRGPGPLSEPEALAIDRLFNRVRPLYSVILHSSRTGKVAEEVIYPWGFAKETKIAPDQQALDEWALQIANRCRKYAQQDRPYEAFRIANPQGDAETYLYWKYGDFACRIEIGAEGEAMQPDAAGMYQVISQVHTGLEYCLNSAARVQTDAYGSTTRSRFDIKVVDDATGAPLEAKLVMKTLSKPMIPFRMTNPRNGRFYWPVWSGFSDTLTVSRFGYEPVVRRVTGNVDPANVNIRLCLLPVHRVAVELNDGALAITSDIELNISHPDKSWDMVLSGGSGAMALPKGFYDLTLTGGYDYVPRRIAVQVYSDTTFHITLAPADIILVQDFDGGDVTFTSDNTMSQTDSHAGQDSLARWDLTDEVFHSFPRSLTDSKLTNTYRREETWAAPYNLFDERLDLSGAQTAALVYWINQALEPGCDSAWVEASLGGSGNPAGWNWTQIGKTHQELSVIYSIPERPWNATPINIQRYGEWRRFVIPLDAFCGQSSVHFRFHLRSDTTIEEDGIYIDDVMVLTSAQGVPEVTANSLIPLRFDLGRPYPNPFNCRSRVEVATPETGQIKVMLYDSVGRLAAKVFDGQLATGRHQIAINAGTMPAGLYFLRAEAASGRVVVRKMMLLK